MKQYNNLGGDQVNNRPLRFNSIKDYVEYKVVNMNKRFPDYQKALNYGSYIDAVFQRTLDPNHSLGLYDYEGHGLGYDRYKENIGGTISIRNAVHNYSGVDMGGF